MILTCTACATRYLVDPNSIGGAGREVRCARCGHTWFQSPARDLPKSIDDDDLPVVDPMAYRPAPNLPALRRAGPPWGLIAGWLILIGFLAALAAGFYQFRERLVALWPASAQLYAALDIPVPGLTLQGVKFERSHAGNVPLLIISGTIVNPSQHVARAPRIRLALQDSVQREMGHEEIDPDQAEIAPGGQARFTARVNNPPPEARMIEVTLVHP